MIISLTLLLPHEYYISILNTYIYISIVAIIMLIYSVVKQLEGKTFYETIMILIIFNFAFALIVEKLVSDISYIPIASFNFILGFFVILFYHYNIYFRKNEILASKASLDSITGLYNRHYLKDLSKQLYKNNKSHPKYVLFLDLDNFKDINDEYGHETGDIVLEIIGQRLIDNVRDLDVVCRYGGDEFIILINSDENTDIHEISQRIIDVISAPIHTYNQIFTIGVSIGISKYNNPETTLDDLLRESDLAMYQAKRKGGNQYVVFEGCQVSD